MGARGAGAWSVVRLRIPGDRTGRAGSRSAGAGADADHTVISCAACPPRLAAAERSPELMLIRAALSAVTLRRTVPPAARACRRFTGSQLCNITRTGHGSGLVIARDRIGALGRADGPTASHRDMDRAGPASIDHCDRAAMHVYVVILSRWPCIASPIRPTGVWVPRHRSMSTGLLATRNAMLADGLSLSLSLDRDAWPAP
jgi:hypothetical protein